MIIIGGGVAGLMAALAAAPRPVTLINPTPLGPGAASWLSQGGMAAAIGEDDDVALHVEDTLAAGAGLCDRDAVETIISSGPAVVQQLLAYGVAFDRKVDGTLALGLEAAHSRHRILHGGGDRTGATIMQTLIEKIHQTASITFVQASVQRILVGDAGVAGVQIVKDGDIFNIASNLILLSTGGIGGLFRYSTNPSGAIGHGLMLAMAAGAILRDLEFVQFHPTALAVDAAPLPLVSEAVRGEGAKFVDENGLRFMNGQDLAPRDVVARGVFAHLSKGHKVFLDTRPLAGRFAERFPSINAACLQAGFDPATQPIPVRPAAHYHMGGIAVDEAGRTNIEGLYAAGEVACTGLHGANRLASNSLLEAAICGAAAGRMMAGQATRRSAVLPDLPLPFAPDAEPVRDLMSAYCGVLRTAKGLGQGADMLSSMAGGNPAAELSLRIVQAAMERTVSAGAHARADFPIQQAA